MAIDDPFLDILHHRWEPDTNVGCAKKLLDAEKVRLQELEEARRVLQEEGEYDEEVYGDIFKK